MFRLFAAAIVLVSGGLATGFTIVYAAQTYGMETAIIVTAINTSLITMVVLGIGGQNGKN